MEREYFYRIDRAGRLWHDDSELLDARFLDFFFRRLGPNDSGRHADWPWLSRCGPELNFARAEATPIVFRKLDAGGLHYAGTLTEPFDPSGVRVTPGGQLLHASRRLGFSLLAPRVALLLADAIEDDGGLVLRWRGREYPVAEHSGFDWIESHPLPQRRPR